MKNKKRLLRGDRVDNQYKQGLSDTTPDTRLISQYIQWVSNVGMRVKVTTAAKLLILQRKSLYPIKSSTYPVSPSPYTTFG
jgi:hypothetical protein